MTSQYSPTYCSNHPQVETTLRCNRCDKPICSKCAVRTPIGYRCPECVRGQQKAFNTSLWYDYPIAFVLASFLSYLGSQLVAYLGFFTLFVAPLAGVIISEVIRFAVRKRRSKTFHQVSATATALGSLPRIFIYLAGLLITVSQGGLSGFGILFPLIWQGVYTFVVASTVYYRLGGIKL